MKTIAALGFLSAFADAVNKPQVIPVDSQIGALDFPLTCQVPILGAYTFAGYYTATAPIYGASGQQIYYTEVNARVTIPKSITQYAIFIGATQASANVKIHLALENATPTDFNTYPNGLTIKNIPIKAGQPAVVTVPKTGFLDPIGPVTLGKAGVEHVIRLGTVDVSVTLQNAQGTTVFGPLAISCTKQPIDYNIGIVNVGPAVAAAPALKFFAGNRTFAAITNNEETGSFRYPYSCAFSGPIGQQDVDLTIAGTIPTYLAPGAKWYLDDAAAFLNLPAAVNAAAKRAYPTVASYRFTVNSFNVNVVNSSPNTYNVLKSPLTVKTPYSADDIVVAIPQNGLLRLGPLTAGTAGRDTTLSSGKAAASVSFLDGAGRVLGTSSVSCAPVKAADIIGVPVTTAKPKAISP